MFFVRARFCETDAIRNVIAKKNERLAINFRDAFERMPQNRLLFVADGLIHRQGFERRRFRNFFQRFGAVTRLAALFAQRIIDEIPRDAAKPRAQFFRPAQTGELFPRGQKCFLRDVLALAQAARGAVSQRADERLIARDNLAEGVAVAGKTRGNQIGVIGRNH